MCVSTFQQSARVEGGRGRGNFQLKQQDANQHDTEADGNPLDRHGTELELLEQACRDSGRSLRFWADLTDGLDARALALLVSRAHMVQPEESASSDSLRQDQNEAVKLFSQVERRDRQVFLRALRGLVGLRKGRLN